MMHRGTWWMKTEWQQQRNTALALVNCSDELIWPILAIDQPELLLGYNYDFWLWQTGQFTCYKTGQIYLLLTTNF